MSDTFTAKTGRTVAIKSRSMTGTILEISGLGTRTTVDLGDVATLREFFLHERDKELGRWRWPENPAFVVYKNAAHEVVARCVRVVFEETASAQAVHEDDIPESAFGRAARAYFAAHPEPRPWHDAKAGEVWVLTLEGESETAQVVDGYGKFMPWTIDVVSDGNSRGKITAGRRIFPEVTP